MKIAVALVLCSFIGVAGFALVRRMDHRDELKARARRRQGASMREQLVIDEMERDLATITGARRVLTESDAVAILAAALDRLDPDGEPFGHRAADRPELVLPVAVPLPDLPVGATRDVSDEDLARWSRSRSVLVDEISERASRALDSAPLPRKDPEDD